MSKELNQFWQRMADEVRDQSGKVTVEHEAIVAYAIENRFWRPQRTAVARLARNELRDALKAMGHRNERGEFVREAYVVQAGQKYFVGFLADAPEEFLREAIDQRVRQTGADCHSIVTDCAAILAERGIQISLPPGLELLAGRDEGETEAA